MNRLATLPALCRPLARPSVAVQAHVPEPVPWPEPVSPDLPGEPYPPEDVPVPLDPLDAPHRTPVEMPTQVLPEIQEPYRPGEQIPMRVNAASMSW